MAQYILPVVLLVVTLGLLGLRTNAAVIFFALCGGFAVSKMAGSDITMLAGSFHLSGANANYVLAAATVLPALILVIFLKGSSKAALLPFQIVPALASALFGAILVLQALPESIAGGILRSTYGAQLINNETPIVLIGVLSSTLITIASLHKKQHHDDKHKKGHH